MIKLVGTPLSNYVATVRAALLAKNLEFTEIDQMPVQEENHLKSSPMGKVPFIETNHGVLTEVNVIFDYLEDIVELSNIIFVCVPTPMKKDGSCDTSIVEAVVKDINDMVISSKLTTVEIKTIIDNNTYTKLSALQKVNDWKLC